MAVRAAPRRDGPVADAAGQLAEGPDGAVRGGIKCQSLDDPAVNAKNFRAREGQSRPQQVDAIEFSCLHLSEYMYNPFANFRDLVFMRLHEHRSNRLCAIFGQQSF